MHWSFSPVVGYWFVTSVALVLLALLWFGQRGKKFSPPRRRTLVYLRLAIIALTILALSTAWIHTTITKQAATLMLLLDQSRSMQVTDGAAKQSRWQVLSQSVYKRPAAAARLGPRPRVQVYTFDAAPQRVSWDEGSSIYPSMPRAPSRPSAIRSRNSCD